jgi:hypothetical protein
MNSSPHRRDSLQVSALISSMLIYQHQKSLPQRRAVLEDDDDDLTSPPLPARNVPSEPSSPARDEKARFHYSLTMSRCPAQTAISPWEPIELSWFKRVPPDDLLHIIRLTECAFQETPHRRQHLTPRNRDIGFWDPGAAMDRRCAAGVNHSGICSGGFDWGMESWGLVCRGEGDRCLSLERKYADCQELEEVEKLEEIEEVKKLKEVMKELCGIL